MLRAWFRGFNGFTLTVHTAIVAACRVAQHNC